jgi:uncharacterized protein
MIDLKIPNGQPCWMDLVTSDTDTAVNFYEEVFGWKNHETPPEMQGYRYFTLDGKSVGGCMQNQPEFGAPNSWSIFLRSDDVRATAAAATANGGTVLMEPMDVGENGSFVIVRDAGGAVISAWQPGTELGFEVLSEVGSPSHFELHTRDYDKSMAFYKAVFGWTPSVMSDTDDFRYSLSGPQDTAMAGVMDASAFLPEDVPAHWSMYLRTDNIDNTLEKAQKLDAKLVQGPDDTPYGKLVTVADPTGAVFKLQELP